MYRNSYTLKTLDGLISNTYILAIVIALLFIVFSLIVANMIAYEGGTRPSDPRRRRIWFFVLGIIGTIAFFLWNLTYVSSLIKGTPAQDKFLIQNAIATGVCLLVYIGAGFLISKLNKKGKYGTIFP